jgi:opacity protein-like surface antigen
MFMSSLLFFISGTSMANDYKSTITPLEPAPAPRHSSYTSIKPVISLGGGAVVESLGSNRYFYPYSAAQNFFYFYQAKGNTKYNGLFEVFIGNHWLLDRSWSVDGGLEYVQYSDFNLTGRVTQGASQFVTNKYQYGYKILPRQFLLEGKFLYHFSENLFPYLLLGAGVAYNNAHAFTTTAPVTRIYKNHNEGSFSYSVGFGVDVGVANNLRLGIGYRFVDLGTASLGSASINGVSAPGTISLSSNYVNELLAQITYTFDRSTEIRDNYFAQQN